MDNRPIGVFDSGLGGLTVVKEIKKLLPNESIIYLGDTARVPYGTRSKETVVKFVSEDADFLVSKNIKCLVIACNTASALAFREVKNSVKMPVFEVIHPGAKGVTKVTKNKKIGVIATRGTIGSQAYQKAIHAINSTIDVFESTCPLFVPFIEEGEIEGKLITQLVKKYLSVFDKRGIDTLVMGCTHYPVISDLINDFFGGRIKLINPGIEVAQELKTFLENNEILHSVSASKDLYFVTDLTERFVNVAEMFLGMKLSDKINLVKLDSWKQGKIPGVSTQDTPGMEG